MPQIPLEEALAFMAFPVYGLTEEVCGLCYGGYANHPKDNQKPFTMTYHTQRYEPFLHKKWKGPTFSVASSKAKKVNREDKPLPKGSTIRPVIEVWSNGKLLDEKESPLALRIPFVCQGDFTIDGVTFSGDITYYPIPLYYSTFSLASEHVQLLGAAYGPNVDELIQILEALQVLNGK